MSPGRQESRIIAILSHCEPKKYRVMQDLQSHPLVATQSSERLSHFFFIEGPFTISFECLGEVHGVFVVFIIKIVTITAPESFLFLASAYANVIQVRIRNSG